jgi:hypothetical protein
MKSTRQNAIANACQTVKEGSQKERMKKQQ